MLPEYYIPPFKDFEHTYLYLILKENGYKKIESRDFCFDKDVFIIYYYSELKDRMIKINKKYAVYPVYTPREVFLNIETLDRLEEYSEKELENIQDLISSADENIKAMGIKILSRIHPKYILKMINNNKRRFYYASSIIPDDPYVKYLEDCATNRKWTGKI